MCEGDRWPTSSSIRTVSGRQTEYDADVTRASRTPTRRALRAVRKSAPDDTR